MAWPFGSKYDQTLSYWSHSANGGKCVYRHTCARSKYHFCAKPNVAWHCCRPTSLCMLFVVLTSAMKLYCWIIWGSWCVRATVIVVHTLGRMVSTQTFRPRIFMQQGVRRYCRACSRDPPGHRQSAFQLCQRSLFLQIDYLNSSQVISPYILNRLPIESPISFKDIL